MKDPFRFAPELFEHRAKVMEKLSKSGFEPYADYSGIDLLHDSFGLEVCGIRDESDARHINALLKYLYPSWRPG